MQSRDGASMRACCSGMMCSRPVIAIELCLAMLRPFCRATIHIASEGHISSQGLGGPDKTLSISSGWKLMRAALILVALLCCLVPTPSAALISTPGQGAAASPASTITGAPCARDLPQQDDE